MLLILNEIGYPKIYDSRNEWIFFFQRVENIVENWENTGLPAFPFLFHKVSKDFFSNCPTHSELLVWHRFGSLPNNLWALKKKPFENIVGKGENAGNQHFRIFQQFSNLSRTNQNIWVSFSLHWLSIFVMSKILSFGKEST